MEKLTHWKEIRQLTAQEAGLLIAGVEPNNKEISSKDLAKGLVYERAIREATERANKFAWEYVRGKTAFEIPYLVDIWEQECDLFQYLPSLEMRHSVSEVLKDPINIPILIPVDPWFTCTVCAGDLNTWLKGNEISSAFKFVDGQCVVVTSLEQNWHSTVNSPGQKEQENEEFLTPKERSARIADVVARHGGNRTKAAKELKISRQRIGQILQKHSASNGKPISFSPQDPFGLAKKPKR